MLNIFDDGLVGNIMASKMDRGVQSINAFGEGKLLHAKDLALQEDLALKLQKAS